MSKIKECFVRPSVSLDLLSQKEILAVSQSNDEVFKIFRDCALAVLNTGNDTDDADALLEAYEDFSVRILPESRGIKLQVNNAPGSAFVDGKMIRGIQEHLFSALRDIIFTQDKIDRAGGFDVSSGPGITDAMFRILRNAGVVRANTPPKLVGYEMGLRGIDIVTGCGIGAMKGPMKGAMIGHAKQNNRNGRYVGISEPGIIASESPNPTVNELVILPDIEKRLEAFVRLGHSFVVFPGGAGTMEEILYLLGLVMLEENQDIPMPLLFAAPAASRHYFEALDAFIRNTLGDEATKYYDIIIDRPDQVAQLSLRNLNKTLSYRRRVDESYAYNWKLTIPEAMQRPFDPTHEAMAKLNLDPALPHGELIAQLRCAFSGIVAGNVKAEGIRRIDEHGPFELHGDPGLIGALDTMLQEFVNHGRMKISSDNYEPCYQLVGTPTT